MHCVSLLSAGRNSFTNIRPESGPLKERLGEEGKADGNKKLQYAQQNANGLFIEDFQR